MCGRGHRNIKRFGGVGILVWTGLIKVGRGRVTCEWVIPLPLMFLFSAPTLLELAFTYRCLTEITAQSGPVGAKTGGGDSFFSSIFFSFFTFVLLSLYAIKMLRTCLLKYNLMISYYNFSQARFNGTPSGHLVLYTQGVIWMGGPTALTPTVQKHEVILIHLTSWIKLTLDMRTTSHPTTAGDIRPTRTGVYRWWLDPKHLWNV